MQIYISLFVSLTLPFGCGSTGPEKINKKIKFKVLKIIPFKDIVNNIFMALHHKISY